MPALASERGCPTRTQPLPQLQAWPCKTNSNIPLRRRAELPCIVLLESKHHRVRWPIVDAASGDCSFILGCCDSSLRLWLLHNGDDLMKQMHASFRLLAAAHDSSLDGVAAHRRSFLPGHRIFAFAIFGWAIALHLHFGTRKII